MFIAMLNMTACRRYDYISNMDDNREFDHIGNTNFKCVTIQLQFSVIRNMYDF